MCSRVELQFCTSDFLSAKSSGDIVNLHVGKWTQSSPLDPLATEESNITILRPVVLAKTTEHDIYNLCYPPFPLNTYLNASKSGVSLKKKTSPPTNKENEITKIWVTKNFIRFVLIFAWDLLNRFLLIIKLNWNDWIDLKPTNYKCPSFSAPQIKNCLLVKQNIERNF